MTLTYLFSILKGSSTSGNFGHSGIPGHRGGSAPGKVWTKGSGGEGTGSLVDVQKIGQLGEKLAMKVFSEKFGTEFTTLNVGINNAPIDVAGDHLALEVKAGLSSNTERTQMWRAKTSMSKKEQEAYNKLSPEDKTAYNVYKKQAVLDRKQKLLDELSKELGQPIKGMTVGVILSPDGKKGDVYAIPGFHISLSWSKYATDEYYLGTHNVED